jgi:hypothetical protein
VIGAALASHAEAPQLLLNVLVGSLGPIGYPLASGLAAKALRGIAAGAEEAVRHEGAIRTEEAVAQRLHEQRQRRLAELHESAVPLLRGLSAQVLDVDDPEVRRACAIEAHRLRRLFAESDDVDDPLRHILNHAVDVVERSGIEVEGPNHGSWPTPPPEVRQALTDGPLAVLATAATYARVTVLYLSDELSVSVMADSGPVPIERSPHPSVDVTTTLEGRMLWVEARWTRSKT